MNPNMQIAASRRMGGDFNLGGISGQLGGGGNFRMAPQGGGMGPGSAPAPQAPPGAQPAPGVTGITPGAIERRVGPSMPASQQLSGAGSMGAPQMGGGMEAPGAMMQNAPDLMGPARSELNAPVGNLENFLRNLQNQRSQER